MRHEDVAQVATWLHRPHVARWWLANSTAASEVVDIRAALDGIERTWLGIVLEDGRAVGWVQWYRCADDPAHAAGIGAGPRDIGIDYALGDPDAIGRGLGTQIIAALVHAIQEQHADAGIIVDPEAANTPSRRVLEKNGFELLDVRPVASEGTDVPMAIYRLPPLAAG